MSLGVRSQELQEFRSQNSEFRSRRSSEMGQRRAVVILKLGSGNGCICQSTSSRMAGLFCNS